MKLEKALRREKKKRDRMVVDGKSIFTIQEVQRKKHDQIKQDRKRKQQEEESY